MSELEYIDRIYNEIKEGSGKEIIVKGFKDRDIIMLEKVMIKLRLLDLLFEYPDNFKEIIDNFKKHKWFYAFFMQKNKSY